MDIQIVEPPAPGSVERFFGKDGPADRLFDRCFGWIENVENDLARYVFRLTAFLELERVTRESLRLPNKKVD